MSIPKPNQEDLCSSMASILIPKEYLKDFDVINVEEKHMEWVIVLREKEDRIPPELSGKAAVLNGYCNPISILTHAFSLKKIYLQFYRRRWKDPAKMGGDYSNTYDLHLPIRVRDIFFCPIALQERFGMLYDHLRILNPVCW